VSRYRQTNGTQHAWIGCVLRTSAGRSVHWARRNLDTHFRSHRSCLPDMMCRRDADLPPSALVGGTFNVAAWRRTRRDLDHKLPRLRADPGQGVTRAAEGIEGGSRSKPGDIEISDEPSVLCLAGPLICIKAQAPRRLYGA